MTAEPITLATRYQVSCIPESINPLESDLFAINVEYRGHGLWAVSRHRRCLSKADTWDYEPLPSSREDDWLDQHRFDLVTALERAKHHAPLVKVNGHTVDSVLARAGAS